MGCQAGINVNMKLGHVRVRDIDLGLIHNEALKADETAQGAQRRAR